MRLPDLDNPPAGQLRFPARSAFRKPLLPAHSFLLAVASLLILFCGNSRAENAIPNGGFELGTAGWSAFVPDESKAKNCRFDVVHDNPHGGASCAVLASDDFARHAVGVKPIPVQPGEHYRVSAWVRADSKAVVKPGGAGFVLRLTLHGSDSASSTNLNLVLGNRINLSHTPPPSDPLPSVWTKTEAIIAVPAAISSIGVDLFVHYAKGAIYVDDVSFEKVDSSVAATPLSGGGDTASGPGGPPATTDDYLLTAFDLNAPGMEKVKAAVQTHDLKAAQVAYLDYRRTASPAKWKLMPSDQPSSALAKDDPLGDDVAAHKIHNLWYDAMQPKIADMGADFDWFHNPLPPTDPNYTTNWMGCVISRTQFWENLASAYWKTRDEKYARAWVEQLQSFATKVPLDYNLNEGQNFHWSPLSAANRMFESWPYAYYHFLNSPSFTPEANWLYTKQIRDHALNLMAGLNDRKRTGNWITAECCGLYTAGVLYPELTESAQWRQIATDRFCLELNKLVPPDGFEAELSPGYHTSTMEQFTVPTELVPLNKIPLPPLFSAKLISMYRALVLVMDQSGNDVPTNDSWVVNAIALASNGLKLTDDPLLQWAASHGRKGTPPPDSTMLPYAGFYAMRGGWKRDDLFLFFRGGPTGIGHVHEEDLEVVLRAWNKTLLFDPGTYSYDKSEMRRYALGTSSHSTIIVDGKWQHEGDSPLPTEPVSNPWATTPLFDYVSSTFDKGYQENIYRPVQYSPMKWIGTLDKSIAHTRRVLFLRPYYALVVDTLDGTGNHSYDNLFQIDAPGAIVDPLSHAIVSQRTDGVQIALYPLEQDHLTVDVAQGQKDPLLGWYPIQHRSVPTARFHKQQDAPAIFATFLYPYQGDSAPPFHANALTAQGDNLWSQALGTPNENAAVALVKDGRTETFSLSSSLTGAIQVEAAGWIIRQPLGGRFPWQGGWGIRSYKDPRLAFTLDAPAVLVFASGANGVLVNNSGESPAAVTFTQPFSRTETLAPHSWTAITSLGGHKVPAPVPFSPLVDRFAVPNYASYVKTRPAASRAPTIPIKINAADITLPAGAVLGKKLGADYQVVTKWNAADMTLSARCTIPQAGWYRVQLRYCSGTGCLISFLINGAIPFEEVEGLSLPSTKGAPPSDGWSNMVSDWHDLILGADFLPGGWKVYLPSGPCQIALREDGGLGANLESISIVPATP
jgi:hypothetical protein